VKQELQEEFTDEQHEVLKSIRISRIIFPILLGLGVVAYLMWKQYDPQEFSQINWNTHTTFWILFSVLLLIGAIIIPNWIRKVLNQRKRRKSQKA